MRQLNDQPGLAVPRIDRRRCTGCGTCEHLCPTGAVEVRGSYAEITQPSACAFCEICESMCPSGAIERPFTVVFAPSEHNASSHT